MEVDGIAPGTIGEGVGLCEGVGGEMAGSKDVATEPRLPVTLWVVGGIGGSSLSSISFEGLRGMTPNSSEGMAARLRRADTDGGSIFRVQ